MDYLKFRIVIEPALSDVLMALMSELPFDAFLETDTGFEAYLPAPAAGETFFDQLEALRRQFGFSFDREEVPYRNWNELWESNFYPVQVDDFCGIRASFHPPFSQVEHELVIDPKMAFGTGHHETTYMVIQMMRHLVFTGVQVLDFGCGTGVLGILASRLGAAGVVGVDIEQEAIDNARDNCLVNGVSNMRLYCGELNCVPDLPLYGTVLANINRNIILLSLPTLAKMMSPGGTLIISGFLTEDEPIMRLALNEHGFQPEATNRRNNWLSMQCKKG